MDSISFQLSDASTLATFLAREEKRLAPAMDAWGGWDEINAVIAESFGAETPGIPLYRRSRYFSLMYREEEGCVCICSAKRLRDSPEVTINPEKLLATSNLAIDVWKFSDCERYLAVSVSEGGRDAQRLCIYDFETESLLPETLENLRFPEVAWHPNSESFIYNKHFDTDDLSSAYAVLSHRLGTPQAQDDMVEDFRSSPGVLPLPIRHFRSPLCFLFTIMGTDFRNRLSWREAGSAAPFRTIQDFGLGKTEPIFSYASDSGWTTLAKTTVGAEKGRIVAIPLLEARETGTRDYVDIVPESEALLGDVLADRDNIVFDHSQFSGSTLTRFDRRKNTSQALAVPRHAYVTCGTELHETAGGFAKCYLPSGGERLIQIASSGEMETHNLSQNSTEPAFSAKTLHAKSADGVTIPMTLCWFDALVDKKTRPTLLHVYGGFGVSMMLGRNVFASAWMRSGGIYAIAHVRGGGEFGTSWHDMGRGKNKAQTIADFLACAEFLLSKSHASKLACWGASHGGFVVTRAINDRPDLFSAVIADVPVTDLLALQTEENGLDTIEEYAVDQAGLQNMSPLSGIRKAAYPPILVITAENDERVPASHAYKYVAEQRRINPDNTIHLWRVQEGGHAGPSDKQQMLREEAIKLGFLRHHLMTGD
jgi:prolyl oligopeptidase